MRIAHFQENELDYRVRIKKKKDRVCAVCTFKSYVVHSRVALGDTIMSALLCLAHVHV